MQKERKLSAKVQTESGLYPAHETAEQKTQTGTEMRMMYEQPGLYLADCMEAMKEFPDKFFDLAIVDPPYGNGTDENSEGGHGTDSVNALTDTKRTIKQERRSTDEAADGQRSTKKRLLHGILRRMKSTFRNCSAFHAIRLYGAVIISDFRQPDVF